jgi:hypothetical protein
LAEQLATLRDWIHTAANDIPKVYAMLQVDPNPRVVFIHRPTRNAPSLLVPQPWDDQIFGLQGDLLHGNQTNLVEWPATPFTCTPMTVVHLVGQIDAAWQGNGGADALGPYGANKLNTEQLQVQGLCPIPYRYVPLCLTRTYTPRAFWTDVIGQIFQDQAALDCAVLVNWARVARTYGAAGANGQPTTPLAVTGLRVPLVDEALSARHWAWVLEDLPALGRTGTTLERQFLHQNATLGNLLQQQVDDAAAAQVADCAQEEFLSIYPQAAVEIQMLCEAATEAALPPIWKILANTKKKEAVIVVSQLLEERA